MDSFCVYEVTLDSPGTMLRYNRGLILKDAALAVRRQVKIMTEYTQKYVIVALLEDFPEGYEFTAATWPLHVTLAGTFSIEWDVNKLIDELQKLSKSLSPVITEVSHDEYFGPSQNLQVAILQEKPAITALHYSIIDLLNQAGAAFNDPQYIGSGYRAHCTVQKHARVHAGQPVTIKNLAIVDMFLHQDHRARKILKVIDLH